MNCPYTLRNDVVPHLNGNRYNNITGFDNSNDVINGQAGDDIYN
ncbi:MAG: hypothetical protein V7K38_04330 [Nostoc sp.]